MTDLKRCSRCKVMLPRANFHNHGSTHDGLQTYCKLCKNEARRGTNRQPPPHAPAYYIARYLDHENSVEGALLRKAQSDMAHGLRERGERWGMTETACAEALWALGRLMGAR